MKNCACMYCLNGVCFKPSKAEPEMLAVPCNGCDGEHAEPTAEALHIIV